MQLCSHLLGAVSYHTDMHTWAQPNYHSFFAWTRHLEVKVFLTLALPLSLKSSVPRPTHGRSGHQKRNDQIMTKLENWDGTWNWIYGRAKCLLEIIVFSCHDICYKMSPTLASSCYLKKPPEWIAKVNNIEATLNKTIQRTSMCLHISHAHVS